MKTTMKYQLNMHKLFLSIVCSLSFIVCSAQINKPVNQLPWDSVPYITNDQMIINKSYGASRYQLSKITVKQFLNGDSIHQKKQYYGQDSIRVTINRDTIKTTQADSLNSLIYVTPYVNSATLYVSAIHTGQYFVVKSTAWTKGNKFNWLIIKTP